MSPHDGHVVQQVIDQIPAEALDAVQLEGHLLLRPRLVGLEHKDRVGEAGKAPLDQRGEGAKLVQHAGIAGVDGAGHAPLGRVGAVDVDPCRGVAQALVHAISSRSHRHPDSRRGYALRHLPCLTMTIASLPSTAA